ncbi:unnamed protein product [Linum tenue]|uniref:FRIGIDA-like protein n=1 Tax=Linum tenue TaxID=586396 RepID=A0AAV0GRQ8_9ROSI|nr:unnamed protein product [Linum tenue]
MVDRVIQDNERDMGSVQQRLEECREELVGKERLLGCLQNYMTEKSNEVELLQNKMKRKTNLLSNSSSELQQKERELAEARNSITVCNAECELEEKQLGVVVGKLQVKEKVTCSTQHNLEECAQELETKQKPLGSIQSTVDWLREKVRVKREELDSLQKSLDEQRNKKQAGTTDGALPCERNPDSPLDGPSPSYLTDSEVSTAIRQSSDPARMIIDQMKESIFQTNTKNYNQTVVRNHIVMLEQLMGVSPKVSPEVEEAATSLAIAWRGNLRQAAHGTVDVLAFLLFFAAFGVGSRFEGEDTLKFVEMVAHHERAPELCRSLGLSKWIPAISQQVSGLGLDPSFLNQKIIDHLQELETRVGRKRSCLIATGLIIQTPRYAGATVSGNKWPLLQLGISAEEGQRKKRQKKS